MKKYSIEMIIRMAVIDHLRRWIAWDAAILLETQSKGEVPKVILQKMNHERSRIRQWMFPSRYGALSKFVASELLEWPDDLVSRASFTNELNLGAKAKHLTITAHVDRISEIVWFSKPHNWMPYSRKVGLALSENNDQLEFASCYEKLNDYGFIEVVADIRSILSTSAFSTLSPERLVERYLSICGGDFFDGQVSPYNCEASLKAIEVLCGKTSLGIELNSLCAGLSHALRDQELFVHARENMIIRSTPKVEIGSSTERS